MPTPKSTQAGSQDPALERKGLRREGLAVAVGVVEADRDLQGAPLAVEVPVVVDAEPGVAAGGTRVGGAGGDVDAQHRWVR